MTASPSAQVDRRLPRSFRCDMYAPERYTLCVIVGGQVVDRINLSEGELRACAETLVRMLGWTPYRNPQRTEEPDDTVPRPEAATGET